MTCGPTPKMQREDAIVRLTDGTERQFDEVILRQNGWVSCYNDKENGKNWVAYPPQRIEDVVAVIEHESALESETVVV